MQIIFVYLTQIKAVQADWFAIKIESTVMAGLRRRYQVRADGDRFLAQPGKRNLLQHQSDDKQ